MPRTAPAQALHEALFADGQTGAWAVLDGASIEGLPAKLKELAPEHTCLYRGELAPDLAAAAPYLARLEADHPFTEWVLDEGWANHWGIFAVAPAAADLRAMRKHFRTFLLVRNPDGKVVYFRYYDPRVMRVYLPTCNATELATVFGPVCAYLMEDEDPATLLVMSVRDRKLHRQAVSAP